MSDLITRSVQNEGFEPEKFLSPDPLFQPIYSWVWNAPVTEEGIDEQLDEMLSCGAKAVYILPEPKEFRPATMRTFLEPDYLSDDFFRMVRYAFESALKRGMTLWMYDEGGWPSGSACTRVNAENPDFCRKTIASRFVTVRGEYRPGPDAVSAFLVSEDGTAAYVPPLRRFDEETQLTEYFAKPLGGYATDPLDPEATACFMRLTHEKYEKWLGGFFPLKHSGGFVPGSSKAHIMFTDEPGAGRFPWPRGFGEGFLRRFGYGIAPYVHSILHDDEEAEGPALQARIDYRIYCAELFRKNYFVPIHDWCRKNGVLSGGHLDMDHISDGCLYHNYGSVLSLLREMDVPGVDVIWRQIDIPKEGRGPCAEGNGFFPRFASSAAAQAGRKYALSESFAIHGQGTTGDEMRYVINFQLVRGINLFNMMSSSYGRSGALAMVARPSLVKEMPEFPHLGGVNDYTARACWLMQLGMPGARTALYYPAREIWAGGEGRKKAIAAFEEAGRSLERSHEIFDIADEEILLSSPVSDGCLQAGLARYDRVVIPEGVSVPEEIRAKLSSLSAGERHSVCQSASLRVSSRVLPDGGRVWMVFNEAGENVSDGIRLYGGKRAVRLYPEDGHAESCPLDTYVNLEPGEAAFFVVSDSAPGSSPLRADPAGTVQPDTFTLQKVRRLLLDKDGVHSVCEPSAPFQCELGPWEKYFGREFSGEADYLAQGVLPRAPGKDETVLLSVRGLECFASVYINEQYAGEAWTKNAVLRLNGRLFGGQAVFTLTLRTANTGANAFAAFSMRDNLDPRDIGQYDERVRPFEARAPKGGLYGPVELSLCTKA
ncbi:MAG: hypothetical protein II912_11770 [Clostridia bacterium]|nr:hypothetical protein [Clostridia bacterium]